MFLARRTNNEADSKADINLPLLFPFRLGLKSEQMEGYADSVPSCPLGICFKIGPSFQY